MTWSSLSTPQWKETATGSVTTTASGLVGPRLDFTFTNGGQWGANMPLGDIQTLVEAIATAFSNAGMTPTIQPLALQYTDGETSHS